MKMMVMHPQLHDIASKMHIMQHHEREENIAETVGQDMGLPQDAAEGVLIGYSKHDHTPPIMPVKVDALCHLRSSASLLVHKNSPPRPPSAHL